MDKAILFLLRPPQLIGAPRTLYVSINGEKKFSLENGTFTKMVVMPGFLSVVGEGGLVSFPRSEIGVTVGQGQSRFLWWYAGEMPNPALIGRAKLETGAKWMLLEDPAEVREMIKELTFTVEPATKN